MVDKAATENNQNYQHQVGDISSEMLPQSDSGSQSKPALSTNFYSGTLKMVDNAATENNQNHHHHLVGDISSDMLPQSDSGSQSKHTLSTGFDSGTLRMVDNAAIENNKNHHHQAGDISSEILPQSDSGSHSKHTLSIDSDLGTLKMVDNAAIENNQEDHHQAGDISSEMLPQSDSGSQSKHTLSIDSDSMGENAASNNDHNHQHRRHQIGDMSIEMLPLCVSRRSDDEGSRKRTGNVWTASANIIVVMVGTGVLSLAWDIAQLGWIAGPAVILFFSFVGYYTSRFLSDCYRTGDPDTGDRNSTYMDSVHSILGGAKVKACGFLQYITLFGNAISCIVEASLCMMAIKYMNCSHESNWENRCYILSNPYMIIIAVTEILLSQIPDFDQIRWISVVAAVMFVTYSLIGLGQGIAQVVDTGSFKGSFRVISVGDGTETQKVWRILRAVRGIANAYSFSQILIETQDTIGSPPSEAKTMKKAISRSTAVMTTIYMLCGCIGYAAFGEATPINFLMKLAFYKPFWLLDISNAAMVINLVGAYQVNSQPIFAFVEKWADQRWRGSELIAKEIKIPVPGLGQYNMNLFRLVWRTVFVILTTVISMLVPFVFNEVVDIISLGFWPLMVYFPVEMYIRQKQIRRWSTKWVYLQMLSMTCLVISIMATVGSVPQLKDDLKANQPFRMSY